MNIEQHERRESEKQFILLFETWPTESLKVSRPQGFGVAYGWLKKGDQVTVYVDPDTTSAEIKYNSLDSLQEAGWEVC